MVEILQGSKFSICPIYKKIRKNSPRGPVGFKMCVCLSVGLSVTNLQGQPNYLQVILGQAVWTPRPWGSGPNPEKCLYHIIYLHLLGQSGCVNLFINERTRQKNVGSGILIFCIWPKKIGPEGRADWGPTKT